MEINQRLKAVRKELNLTQVKFGEEIGVVQGYITNLENNRREVTNKVVKLVCSIYNVNEEWLRTGQGTPFNQPRIAHKNIDKALEIFQDLRPEFQDYALRQIDALLELQKKACGETK